MACESCTCCVLCARYASWAWCIAQDNEDAASILSEILRAIGHEPLLATTGPQALELATSRRPHLVFLDIGLPGMDGFEVAARLRPRLPGARLLAMSGYSTADMRARAAAAGFDDYLVKPLDAPTIARALIGDWS